MARRSISGLRTIVTGASSGIGRALVIDLVLRGAKVVALARRRDRLQELADELQSPARFCWFAGDVTRQEDRAAALEMAQSKFGGLDALVNNAGLGALGPFAEADESRLRQVMEVNFFAPAEFVREALPLLRQGQKPLVVNIGSVLGHRAVPEKSEYCASKFALHGLSDALRIEFSRSGIDLLLVSPSTTSSEFFDNVVGADVAGIVRKQSRFGAMSPVAVARRIVSAIAAGRREIILSTSGKLIVWLDRLCPPLADWLITRWG